MQEKTLALGRWSIRTDWPFLSSNLHNTSWDDALCSCNLHHLTDVHI